MALNFMISLVAGVVASILVFLFLFMLRPKFKVSEKLAYDSKK